MFKPAHCKRCLHGAKSLQQRLDLEQYKGVCYPCFLQDASCEATASQSLDAAPEQQRESAA